MVLKDMIEVLTIVAKYVDPNEEWLESGHDVIWLPLFENNKLSEEDKARFDELGVHIGDSDCYEVST